MAGFLRSWVISSCKTGQLHEKSYASIKYAWAMDKISREIMKVSRLIMKISRLIMKISRLIMKISRSIMKISRSIMKISRSIMKVSRSIMKVSRSIMKISREIMKIVREIEKIVREIEKIVRLNVLAEAKPGFRQSKKRPGGRRKPCHCSPEGRFWRIKSDLSPPAGPCCRVKQKIIAITNKYFKKIP